MELLLYNKVHWMDKLKIDNPIEFNKKMENPIFKIKYDSRYQIGDIVETQKDGFFTGKEAHGYNKNVFTLIVLKDINVSHELMDSIYYAKKLLHKRRWKSKLNITGIDNMILSDLTELNLEDKLV